MIVPALGPLAHLNTDRIIEEVELVIKSLFKTKIQDTFYLFVTILITNITNI